MAVRRDYIAGLYRDILGREGSEGEISGWEGAPDENAVRNMFLGSPEYAARTGGQSSWHNDDSGRIVSNAPAAPPPQYQIQGGGGDDLGVRTAVPKNDTLPIGGSANTPTTGAGANSVGDLYLKYLGRSASPDELSKWLSGAFGWGDANNLAGIERGISTSEEAARHRAATPKDSYNTAPYTGFTPNHDYSAFNTARQQDPGKSAKDAFALISNQAPPPPFGSKASLHSWFQTYIQPGMEALGHHIVSSGEDGFTFSNSEGTFFVDFSQNSGAAPGSMVQRLQWNATPADDATRQRYAGSGGAGTGAGASAGAPRSGAPSGPIGDVRSLYEELGKYYGGPGGPGITSGPLQQVGQDPLSLLITGGLADFINRGGSTPLGSQVQNYLLRTLGIGGGDTSGVRRRAVSSAGAGGDDQTVGIEPWLMGDDGDTIDMVETGAADPFVNGNIARRFESARELMAKGRRTQMNDARGELAARNLLSEPGIPQGAEIGAVQRIEDNIAPEFARALRDIYTEETGTALQLATGMAADQARTFLAGLGEGTARQTALASIALQQLGQNMAWSQFLAEFGLKRDQTLQMLQNGRVDDVMQLLNTFLSLTSLSRGGYV